VRRHELRLLDVHRLARSRDRMDEIGLAGEEGRRLEHVDHLGDRRDLRNVVDVGQDRHAERVADLLENAQPLVHAGPAKALVRRAVGLVEARLEDEQDAELVGDRLQPLGGAQLQLLAFDHARAGDEEQGLVEPDFASEQLHRPYLGEPVDDRHRLPVAEPILRGEILRERLAGVDPPLTKTVSKPMRAAPRMSVWSPSPTASTSSRGGSPARCSAWRRSPVRLAVPGHRPPSP
jgi:hypothetical protein